MSHRELQRVVVRMLFDPALVDAVYRDAAAALAGVDLTDEERASLTHSDRRRWMADPLRRKRSLKALLDEFKGASALAVAATGRVATLDAFFSSSAFHDCIQTRGSLAMAYAAYLQALGSVDPRITAVARLEAAVASARRGRMPTGPARPFDLSALYVRSSHASPVLLPAGTLEVLQAVEQVLFEISLAPVAALADDGPSLAHVPLLGEADAQALLAERSGEGDHVGLSEATAALVRLLHSADRPVTAGRLVERACELGADRADAPEVVQSLVDDRLLVPAG